MNKRLKDFTTPSLWRSLFSYAMVYVSILAVFVINANIALREHPLLLLLAIVFIAGRQHSLYILNHDACHYSLFKSKKVNRWVATLLSNAAMFHHPEAWSYVQWRRIHLKHHSHLFTENDPNYLSRKIAGDTEQKITPFRLLMKCLISSPLSVCHLFFGKQDYCFPKSDRFERQKISHLKALFSLMRNDPEMNNELAFKWTFFMMSAGFIAYFNVWSDFLLLWIVPMYTVYPMILTYFDLTEHHWEVNNQDPMINTQSVSRGCFTGLILSTLPRSFHREHHWFPRVPAQHLSALNKMLKEQQMEVPHD